MTRIGDSLALGLLAVVSGCLGLAFVAKVQGAANRMTCRNHLRQLGLAGVQPVIAQRGQRGGAALAVRQGLQEPAAAAAHQVRDHAGDLQQGILQDLLDPVLVTDPVMGQVRPQPGQRPQVANGLRRQKAVRPRDSIIHPELPTWPTEEWAEEPLGPVYRAKRDYTAVTKT